MNVGVVGLGLIGGSLAKAYKLSGHTVYAFDKDQAIQDFALVSKATDAVLDNLTVPSCDLIFIAVYPCDAIAFLEENAHTISASTMVIDCCGTKKTVCEAGFKAAEQFGFTFIGGHPMAGIEQSGFKHSHANLFQKATMIIVPPTRDDIELLDKVKRLLSPAGFGKITVTTAESHDKMIAFTSQMAHLVSNTYIKSPTATLHEGFSAGSYKDMTRVAWLNEHMWTELFLENRVNLISELDVLLASLQKYREALEAEDTQLLITLLKEGKDIKESLDRS